MSPIQLGARRVHTAGDRRASRLRSHGRAGQRGQALLVMVGVLLVTVAMVALIVDGGNAWAQQRITQNGSDATAEAGAIVLAEKLAGQATPAGGWDAAVLARVTASGDANGIGVDAAYYTDICGIPLRSDGTAALNGDGTENLTVAARVGTGFPSTSNITPDCPSRTVGPPAGVLVVGHKSFRTYVAGAIGITNMATNTRATAAAGWLQGLCDSAQGEACALLPVTIPVTPISCANNGDIQWETGDWSSGVTYRVPLCKGGPGNVGWLDWDKGGGTKELIDSIHTPDNPPIDLPSWQHVPETGNVNSGGVEDAINSYDGQIVLIPMFDVTCSSDPNDAQVNVGPNYGCPSADIGGNGSRQWYRFPWFAAFRLCGGGNTTAGCTSQGAYIQGSNGSVCGSAWNGAGCLVGQFVNIIKEGTISANGGGGAGPTKVVGVQLIK